MANSILIKVQGRSQCRFQTLSIVVRHLLQDWHTAFSCLASNIYFLLPRYRSNMRCELEARTISIPEYRFLEKVFVYWYGRVQGGRIARHEQKKLSTFLGGCALEMSNLLRGELHLSSSSSIVWTSF